jgi:ADP-ribosylglycohydrolase
LKQIKFEEYYNKILGSWLGRVAGDQIGAPVEFRPYIFIKHKYGIINSYLKPVDINFVNDDEMYEICALIALEKYGSALKSKDIAKIWVNHLYRDNYTAENAALKNLRNGIEPPKSAINKNIWYDAIGAQMRADIWGLICPGCPEMAKYYAEIDGSISHAGIGIEGEIFVAILISNAFFETNIRKNIQNAITYLPTREKSAYTDIVLTAIDLYDQYPNNFRKARQYFMKYWSKVRKELKNKADCRRRYKFLNRLISGVHILPNAGFIIFSLLYGRDNKEDPLGLSICTAAMLGLDTDCNCGNVGAIIGAQIGAKKIKPNWSKPLKNTFNTYVKGHENWKISELALRIAKVGKQICETKCKSFVRIE